MLKKLLQATFALCLTGAALKAQCPTPNAGPDQTICVGTTSTVTVSANLPVSYTGTWSKVGFGAQGTITSVNSGTTTVTGLTNAATLRLVWTLSDGASCVNLRDTVTIYVQALPTATNLAGNNRTICAGGTATMNATALTAGNVGTWSVYSGVNSTTAVVTDVNDRQSTVTGLYATGVDTLVWTITNAACGGTKTDTVVIRVNAAPTPAYAGADIQTCQGDTVQLIGNTPTVGTPTWTLPFGSGASFYPTNGANNDTVGLRGTTAQGNISVAYRIATGTGTNFTVLNGCISVDTVVVRFTSANAGPDIKLCKTGPGTVRMAATPLIAGETGMWTFVKKSGSEVISSPTSYSTNITAVTSDTLILRWTVTAGACSDSDDMSVIVLGALPTVASVGNDITGCVGDTIQLRGSIATSGTPAWTRVGAGFFGAFNLPFIPDGNNDTIKVAMNTAGTYKLYYTISVGTAIVGSTCTSRDSLNVFVNTPPAANAGLDQASCSGQTTFTVTADKPDVGTGIWSKVSGTGTLTRFDSVGVISGVNGNVVLKWTVNDGVCTSVDEVAITTGVPSVANAGIDKTTCRGDTIQLIGNPATSGSAVWSTPGGGFTTTPPTIVGNANNDTISVGSDAVGSFGGLFGKTTPGTYNFIYTISVGANATGDCVSRDTVVVTIQDCAIGIDENNNGSLTVSLQPNPASGSVNVALQDTQTGAAELSVLTPDGRTIATEQLGSVKDVVKTINISELSAGVYFVKVTKGGNVYVTKLIVQ